MPGSTGGIVVPTFKHGLTDTIPGLLAACKRWGLIDGVHFVVGRKLYFYDTGLACNLLGVTMPQQLDTHFMRGALFENLVINQFVKDSLNSGQRPDLTFWRDSTGLEVGGDGEKTSCTSSISLNQPVVIR